MIRTLLAALVTLFFAAGAPAQVPDPARFAKTFSHRTETVNGVRIHYVIGGTGSPLVLLHGFPETWYAWRRIMPALAKRHTLIVPDLRGAGESEKPAGGYDKQTMAEDVHQLVGKLGFRRIDLVGHDIGAAVAFAYAAAHRDEVGKLALLDVPPQGTKAFDAMAADSWVFKFQQQRDLAERLVAGRERDYLVSGFYHPFAHDPDAFAAEDVDTYVAAYAAPGAMRAAFEWYRAFDEDIRVNRESLKVKLPMPVLMLGGAQSGGPLMARTAAEIAIDGRAEVIADCGHWMVEEQPDAVLRHLSAFLDERRR